METSYMHAVYTTVDHRTRLSVVSYIVSSIYPSYAIYIAIFEREALFHLIFVYVVAY